MDDLIEKHMDVLQNIEGVVARAFRSHPELTDFAVDRVYEALIDLYTAEKIGRPPRDWRLRDTEQQLFEQVRDICNFRLGRDSEGIVTDESAAQVSAVDVDTMIRLLKRLRKSVRKWNRELGSRGYLNFICQFLP